MRAAPWATGVPDVPDRTLIALTPRRVVGSIWMYWPAATVKAVATPAELVAKAGTATIEEAFLAMTGRPDAAINGSQ